MIDLIRSYSQDDEAANCGRGSDFSPDPVYQDESGAWYFWDETGADRVGPYATQENCRRALHDYALSLGDEQ